LLNEQQLLIMSYHPATALLLNLCETSQYPAFRTTVTPYSRADNPS